MSYLDVAIEHSAQRTLDHAVLITCDIGQASSRWLAIHNEHIRRGRGIVDTCTISLHYLPKTFLYRNSHSHHHDHRRRRPLTYIVNLHYPFLCDQATEYHVYRQESDPPRAG